MLSSTRPIRLGVTPYRLAGRSPPPSRLRLTRICLRCAIHGSAGQIRRLNGRGNPSPTSFQLRRLWAPRVPGAGVADQRRQDAGAQAGPSERSPWMGAVNVRRRDMGSPKPASIEPRRDRLKPVLLQRYFFISFLSCASVRVLAMSLASRPARRACSTPQRITSRPRVEWASVEITSFTPARFAAAA